MSKHIPRRMCVICRNMIDKNELIRLVYEDTQLIIDRKQNILKRGTYICKNPECIEKARKKRAFSKILKKDISERIYEEITEYAAR